MHVMGSNRQDRNRPLQVTLEFVEILGAHTRLAQAFRLILAHSPTYGPNPITGTRQKETETNKQDCEADP